MGPRRYRRGSPHKPAIRCPSPHASMGPRRYRRGSFPLLQFARLGAISFNGAATLPSRIAGFIIAALCNLKASMGPRRYRRGSHRGDRRARGLLQASMGPRRYRRGSATAGPRGARESRASMGPRRYRRGSNPARFLVSSPSLSASMGPRRYRRGSRCRSEDAREEVGPASMGPRRYRRGSSHSDRLPGVGQGASMGPRRYRRGSFGLPEPSRHDGQRFNGAATLPSRIVRSSTST